MNDITNTYTCKDITVVKIRDMLDKKKKKPEQQLESDSDSDNEIVEEISVDNFDTTSIKLTLKDVLPEIKRRENYKDSKQFIISELIETEESYVKGLT
jgi:mannose-6-phosphate isomerase class I